MWLTRELMDVLACPRCKGALELQDTSGAAAREDRSGSTAHPGGAANDVASALICHACARSYPVIHQIPNFMPDPDTTQSS
ncbi:MAG TPA: Trm112 family protein [Polyangiaceae bacterium]|nr:Trm112 family protein [Polyangiaceae bacterium]